MLAERIPATQLAEMAILGASLAMRLNPRELPRLAELLAPLAEEPGHFLDVRLEFRAGPESTALARIEVRGVLPLICQRCAGAVSEPVDVDVLLSLVPDDDATGDLADPFDSILLDDDGALRLRDAVEDEVLAALPLAPKHADTTDCRPSAEPEPAPQGRTTRPFAGLGSLLGRQGRDGPDD